MAKVKLSVPLHGKVFTYTLIGSKDITHPLD